MADEWLRADQVAAMRLRAAHHERRPISGDAASGYAWRAATCDVPALCAQDGRWRALVGALIAACWCSRQECIERRFELSRQAQAALDGAPPPTRGAAE